ncbi:MAG: DUF1080 domain-containing protein [Bacteroidales bacterium]
MKKILVLFSIALMCPLLSGQSQERRWQASETEWYHPVPPVVTPGDGVVGSKPPSDAIILFDGTDFSAWTGSDGEEVKWKIVDDAMVVEPKTGDIWTRESFGDCQLYIEWRTPAVIEGDGQNRGNSGVFLQNTYEVQILDSYNNSTYVNGQAGSIYKQKAPKVNASKPPGEWQVFEIIWRAPRFGTDGVLEEPARITVMHNGILIHDNYELKGHTPHGGLPRYTPHGRLPIRLQDHSTPNEFRNIWVRNL